MRRVDELGWVVLSMDLRDRFGIADFVRFYNQVGEHSSLGYIPPADFFVATQKLNQNVA